jgi:hypothetical protein
MEHSTSRGRRGAGFRHSLAAALTATAALAATAACAQRSGDIRIDDTAVFPESVTSTAAGAVYAGSTKGNVYRALPSESVATAWIKTTPENGILAILGVLADEPSGTLWLCSAPNFFGPERSQGVSALMAFDLATGAKKGEYPFPPPASVCNDIAVDDDGTAFATDTQNGRIFTLAKGTQALTLYGEDRSLIGIDGIAFAADGTLYINNVRSNQIVRVADDDGSMGALTVLELSEPISGPDGFRPLGNNRFLQAEGNTGRVSVVTIDGNRAVVNVLSDEFVSTPGATAVGDTAYVLESNIRYLTDAALRGQDPGPFVIHAVPIRR